MKIAFINIYSGINHRGAEAFAHQLAVRLNIKHKVTFYQTGKKTTEQNCDVVQLETNVVQPQSKVPDSRIGKLRKILFLDKANISVLLFTLSALPKIIRNKYNLVFALNGFWQLLILKIFQFVGKYKLVVTGHSGPGWDDRWNLYLKPDFFIAITKPGYEWALSKCFWTKISLIPLAVDTDTFKKAVKAKLSLKQPVILCPSALVPYKQVHLAVEAVAKLANTSLLILGAGEQEEEIRKKGKEVLGGRFSVKQVSHDKIASYMKAASIVTLPSSPQENAPMVFLESMASNKLVVTTDTPRNRWILGKAGIYCDPLQIKDYSQALEKGINISEDKDRARIINAELNKHKWSKVVKQYEELLIH